MTRWLIGTCIVAAIYLTLVIPFAISLGRHLRRLCPDCQDGGQPCPRHQETPQ